MNIPHLKKFLLSVVPLSKDTKLSDWLDQAVLMVVIGFYCAAGVAEIVFVLFRMPNDRQPMPSPSHPLAVISQTNSGILP